MRNPPFLSLFASLAVAGSLIAGCGDDEESPDTNAGSAPPGAASPERDRSKGGGATEQAAAESEGKAAAGGPAVTIEVGASEFGQMLFDSNRQAIYIFENDTRNETVCYGECARAWPPVLTGSAAVAGSGVNESLLGTVERRNGDLQVTYSGQPLYYYAHEAPGEVRCHNVNLNGGFWWVVGPDGKRRP
jgi:predicted lipoprotein with Yx(FWY)xxD motif